ncbi:unnamed protein product [Clavelina lepadiformis]|uniref:GB1/RHD3-type G domain-containing protein n=1 Tax=Clavelina lepadiformis TaxID=159417 RepID=A0ABP0FJ54_CLALP
MSFQPTKEYECKSLPVKEANNDEAMKEEKTLLNVSHLDVKAYRKIMKDILEETKKYSNRSDVTQLLRFFEFFPGELEDLKQPKNSDWQNVFECAFNKLIKLGKEKFNPTSLHKAFCQLGNRACADSLQEFCNLYHQDDSPCTSTAESKLFYEKGVEHQAIQIFRVDDKNKKFEFYQERVEKIFLQEGVANTPVAIYSIAGKLRQGKSFLLNLFLRYLKMNKSSDWLGKIEDIIEEKFFTRGGKHRCTEGVWIWDEPFFIDTKNGKVALFLMDTQGTFDRHTSIHGTSIIFALSLLSSSFQIYNNKDQIDESDLQHLQLFIDYARMAYRKSQQHAVLEKPLQNLMFLIRDWRFEEEFGFEGGKKVLDDFLETRDFDDESTSVRSELRNIFETLQCFLMPQPGRKVDFRREKDRTPIKIKDLESTFREELDVLVHNLFQDTIEVKKINTKPVTGQELATYLNICVQIFQNVDMNDPRSIAQGNAEASMTITINAKRNDYEKRMNETDVSQQILEEFVEQPKLGSDELIAKSTDNLIDAMIDKFSSISERNNFYKETAKRYLCELGTSVCKQLKMDYQTTSNGRFQDDDEFEVIMAQCRASALKYHKEEAKVKDYQEELLEENKPNFEQLLETSVEEIKLENYIRKEKLVELLQNNSNAAKRQYQAEMEKNDQDYMSTEMFEEVHNAVMESSLGMIDEIGEGSGSKLKEEWRKELQKYINQQKSFFAKINQRNNLLGANEQVSLVMNRCKKVFNQFLLQVGETNCADVAKLNQSCDVAESATRQFLFFLQEDENLEESILNACLSKLEEVLNDERDKIKNKVNLQKTERLASLRKNANTIVENHRKELEAQMCNDDHTEESWAALGRRCQDNEIKKLPQCDVIGLEDDYMEIRKDLQKRLREDFNLVSRLYKNTKDLSKQKKLSEEALNKVQNLEERLKVNEQKRRGREIGLRSLVENFQRMRQPNPTSRIRETRQQSPEEHICLQQ